MKCTCLIRQGGNLHNRKIYDDKKVISWKRATAGKNRSEICLQRYYRQFGKYFSQVAGFVGNRLQFALLREAQYLLETGVAPMEDIGTAVELSIGRRLDVTGPFITADLGGLDGFKAISDYTFPDMSNRTEASITMNQLVAEGHLGEKSGKGYYNWDTVTSKETSRIGKLNLFTS